jgi:hypothetical protein
MKLRRLLASLVTVLGVGCTGAPAPTPTTTPSFLTGVFPSPIPSTPEPMELEELVLVADLDEPPARWDQVIFVPFGDGRNELGYKPSRESPTIGPNSFAVAPDGSVWIIDAAKQRVAHFSQRGELTEEIRDSVGSGSTDLTFVGETLYVIAVYHKGLVFPILPDGRRSAPNVITENGRTVYARSFIPTTRGLFVEVGGYTEPVATGPKGIYALDLPGSGYIKEVPGMILENGTAFSLSGIGDREFILHFVRGDREFEQPLRVRVIASKRFGKRNLVGPVGPRDFVVDSNDVYMHVKVAVTKPGSDGDQIGGRFLLRVGESPILFERLPEPTRIDDTQVRHIGLGPDGHLYLMRLDKDGVRIFRR